MTRRKSLFSYLVLLLCSIALMGCPESDSVSNPDGNGNEDEGKPPAEMLGVWKFQSASVNGNPVALSDLMDWVPMAVRAEIQILENGAYVYQEVNSQGGQLWFESGFVYVEGGEIDVNVQQDGDGARMETVFFTYTLSNGIFTLTENDEGDIVVLVMTR